VQDDSEKRRKAAILEESEGRVRQITFDERYRSCNLFTSLILSRAKSKEPAIHHVALSGIVFRRASVKILLDDYGDRL